MTHTLPTRPALQRQEGTPASRRARLLLTTAAPRPDKEASMPRLKREGVTLILGAEEEEELAMEVGGEEAMEVEEEAIVEVEEVEEAMLLVEEEAMVEVWELHMVLGQTRCLRTTRSLSRGSPPTAVRKTSSSTLAPSELSRLTRKRVD